MAGKFSVEAIFKAVDRFSLPVAKMQAQTERFTKGVSRGIAGANSAVDGLASGLKKVGIAAVGATAIAAVALKDIVDTGATFEKTMIAAAAKFSPAIRQGTAEFERLRLTAEEVGATTEFNAQQAAAGLKDLASAGFGVNQAIAALPGVVDLATAAEVDLATASNIAGKALGAFGLKTEDATQLGINLARVNDTLSTTADKTSANIEGLFESIKEGGPVATGVGASLETFLAMAGRLSEAGIEGSVAGTTLKNVWLSLAKPSTEAAAALKELKISTIDAKTGNLRDMVTLFGELEAATKGMGTGKKAAILEGIFGKIPIAGVSALLSGGTDKIAKLREQLEAAKGSTAEMAGIMRDSTTGDIDSFTSAIDGVKIAIFGVVSGPLRKLLQGMTEWIGANRQLIATRVKEFLEKAPGLISAFASGLKDGFSTAAPVVSALLKPLGSLVNLLAGKAEANPAGSEGRRGSH
jgi:TP901 family phage tail tape measure protein